MFAARGFLPNLPFPLLPPKPDLPHARSSQLHLAVSATAWASRRWPQASAHSTFPPRRHHVLDVVEEDGPQCDRGLPTLRRSRQNRKLGTTCRLNGVTLRLTYTMARVEADTSSERATPILTAGPARCVEHWPQSRGAIAVASGSMPSEDRTATGSMQLTGKQLAKKQRRHVKSSVCVGATGPLQNGSGARPKKAGTKRLNKISSAGRLGFSAEDLRNAPKERSRSLLQRSKEP